MWSEFSFDGRVVWLGIWTVSCSFMRRWSCRPNFTQNVCRRVCKSWFTEPNCPDARKMSRISFVVLLATLEGLSPGRMNRSEIHVDAGLKFHLFQWFSLQSPHNTCACERSSRKVTLLMNPWAVLIDSLHSESSGEKTQPINPIFLSHRFRSSSTSLRLPVRHFYSPLTWLLHPRSVHKRRETCCASDGYSRKRIISLNRSKRIKERCLLILQISASLHVFVLGH